MDFGILFFFLDFDRYHNLKVSYRVVLIFTARSLHFRGIKHKNFPNGKSKTRRHFPNGKLNPKTGTQKLPFRVVVQTDSATVCAK